MSRRPAAPVLLVVAKAPVAGFAKTRLCPPATPRQAADLAAAALLDTLDAVRAVSGDVVVALTGAIAHAQRAAELQAALDPVTVLPQRGATFAQRLAGAHADAAAVWPGRPVLQIGMDTPQVTVPMLAEAAEQLRYRDAVLGPALDGGWWALGLREPSHGAALATVPMSEPDTGARTAAALRAHGLDLALLAELSDVDTMADARRVAAEVPGSRFAAAYAAAARTREWLVQCRINHSGV